MTLLLFFFLLSKMNCCIPFCESSRKEETGRYDPVDFEINFHNFPKDDALKEKWIAAIRGGGLQTYFTWRPSERHPYVCSLHFKPEDFTFCKTHKHLVPESVPSLFPKNPKPGPQKPTSTKIISSIVTKKKTLQKVLLKTHKKKKHKLNQRNIKSKSKKVAGVVKKSKTCNTVIKNKNQEAFHDDVIDNDATQIDDVIDNDATQIDAVNTDISNTNLLIDNDKVKNAKSSEAINQSHSENTVSIETTANDNSNNVVNNTSTTDAVGNTNLSYLGQFAINKSDKKVRSYKIFQCTIKKPIEPNNTKVANYVDMYPYAKPVARTNADKISVETAEKVSTGSARTSSEMFVPEIITRVFSSTENCNLLLKKNPMSAVDTTNINDNKSNNNENNNRNCDRNPSDHSSNLSENIVNDSAEEKKEYMESWRSGKLSQISKFKYNNKILQTEILKLKESMGKRQTTMKIKNEMLKQFNIEALEKGVKNKDAKSLFLSDQLRSLTRDQILWSETTVEFMRRLVKKFPESYNFLKGAGIFNFPSPKALGCRKVKRL